MEINMEKEIQEQITKLNSKNRELQSENTKYGLKINKKLIKVNKIEEEIKILKEFKKKIPNIKEIANQ